ncbi:MAG: hypothetical protein J5654_12290, partial [Victivallales bacterium]|nr:hypothetical protein [Victivallales bacterium]
MALLLGGGLWSRHADATPLPSALPPLFALTNCVWNDLDAEWALPVIDLDGDTLIIGGDTWLGPEDLSARLQIGWCEEGVLVRACVKDTEVVADLPEEQLWKRDALEIMVAPATAGELFDFGPSLQLVCAPPDPGGAVRHNSYSQRPPEPEAIRLAGRRVPGGYELRALLRWALFGKESLLREGDAIRIHIHLDDYDSRDAGGETMQPRVMTINGIDHRGDLAKWYAFRLEGPFVPETGDYDLTPYCHPLPFPRLVADDHLRLAAPIPVRYEVLDAATGELLAEVPATKAAVIPCSDRPKLLLIARPPRADGLVGHLTGQVSNRSALARQIGRLATDDAAPDRQVQALGVLSALEWSKAINQGTNPRCEEELNWRLRRLAGEDVSEAPGLLRFLNLMGDSDGLVTIAFGRGSSAVALSRDVPGRATLTVSWGTLPVIYTELRVYPDDAAAAAMLVELLAFKSRIEARELPGFDELWLARGHLLGDALPWDLDLERLVTVTCARNPHSIVRLVPEDALALDPVGFTCLPDAPLAMVERLAAAGLRELSEEEAAATDGHVIRLGSGPYAEALPRGVTYF